MPGSNNPFLREDRFEKAAQQEAMAGASSKPMTIAGTVQKTAILLGIATVTACAGWVAPFPILALVLIFVNIGLLFYAAMNPMRAKVIAPIYAGLSGYVVGCISVFTFFSMAGTKLGPIAIPLALLGTFVTLAVMLGLFVKRIIRVTETMRSIIIGATIAVFFTYTISLVASLFLPKVVGGLPIYQNGAIGIGFSLFVIVLAAFNFLLDFDMIERYVNQRAPEELEWYASLGLFVTIVWLYLEILRLMRKLSR